MHRRTFCHHAVASGVAASLYPLRGAASSIDSSLAAVTTNGEDLAIDATEANALKDSLGGRLVTPVDSAYDDARKVWNGMIDRRPAMIAQCQSPNDVVNAVTFAADRNLLVAVRCGGHSYPGKSTCDKGLLIDLSPMRKVSVDPDKREVSVAGGALLAQVDGATMEHQLITTTGIVSHTGIGGFALGGGMGRTDRVHGLAVDNLLSAELVTPDGQIRQLGPGDNADLFWAVRGGGGNFGVVTHFRFRLHPFNPNYYGGSVTYPWSQARQALEFYAEAGDWMPDRLSAEPLLIVNENEDRLLTIELVYAGEPAEGEKLCNRFRELGKPASVDLGIKFYGDTQTAADAYFAHGRLNYLKSGYLLDLTPAAIDAIVDSFEGDFLPDCWFQHLGGASARVEATATAYPHRKVHSNYGISAVWDDPEESDERIAKIREIYNAMRPFMTGYYTNLNEENQPATSSNYGVNFDRLLRVKQQYDPANLFRLNANIRPA